MDQNPSSSLPPLPPSAASDLPVLPSVLPLREGRFSGRGEFAELIRQALAAAANQGWREIILCDADFDDWPLGERSVVESLNHWSKTGRKLTLLAGSYATIMRRHARFVSWRHTWSHLIECRGASGVSGVDLPSALWSPAWVFERLDHEHCTGIAGSEAVRRVALKERLAERSKV